PLTADARPSRVGLEQERPAFRPAVLRAPAIQRAQERGPSHLSARPLLGWHGLWPDRRQYANRNQRASMLHLPAEDLAPAQRETPVRGGFDTPPPGPRPTPVKEVQPQSAHGR